MSLILDGVTWPLTAKLRRKASMEESDISGLMLDRTWLRDVIGTYVEYEVEIAVPQWAQGQYAAFYEMLTDPVDGHTLVAPYNDTLITITGKIDVVEDEYVRQPSGRHYWRNTKFTIKSNHPTKELSLGTVISRGRAPMPDLDDGTEGDVWTYTNGQWIHGHYTVADDVYY